MKTSQDNFLDGLFEIVPLTDLVPIIPSNSKRHSFVPDEDKRMTIYLESGSMNTLTRFTQDLKRHDIVGYDKDNPSPKASIASFFTTNDFFVIKFSDGGGTRAATTQVKGVNSFSIRSKDTWQQVVQRCLEVDNVDLKKAFTHKSFGLSKSEIQSKRDTDGIPYIAIPLDVIKSKLTHVLTKEGLTTNSGSSLENHLGG